jgi:hypothetical protein
MGKAQSSRSTPDVPPPATQPVRQLMPLLMTRSTPHTLPERLASATVMRKPCIWIFLLSRLIYDFCEFNKFHIRP